MPDAEKIGVLPSVFAESAYLLEGRPFRLTNRHYLKAIYDSSIEEGMIMSGRQVEKSTTESTHMANYTLLIPYFKALYFAPLTDQVSTFSKERIGKLYRYSQQDVVKRHFTDTSTTDNVHEKTFTNGSVNYFKHCFEYGDNIRGISVNGVWGDELQDIHIDAIPVVKETQSHALESGAGIKVTWFTGTPKTFSNTIQQYWDRSTQNEWVVKCPHCNKYQILGPKNMTPDKYICRFCHKEIPDYARINGMWIETQPGRALKGFRISQLMVPWITPSEIWGKYTTYSSGKFYNEVLGRSFEDAEKPFNQLILNRISSNNLKFYARSEGEFANKQVFMGVDWGKGEKSFTVVSIFSYNTEGKFQMLYAKKYAIGDELELEYQVRDVANMMRIFKVAYCVVDWGFGFMQYQMLRKMFGNRVASCYYSFNLKADNKWDPKDQKWVVNRTNLIASYVEAVKQCDVVWPGGDREQYTWLYDHHLAELAEYRKSQNGKSEDLMYNHPEGSADDGLHSCVYAWLASKMYKASPNNAIKFSSAYGATI